MQDIGSRPAPYASGAVHQEEGYKMVGRQATEYDL